MTWKRLRSKYEFVRISQYKYTGADFVLVKMKLYINNLNLTPRSFDRLYMQSHHVIVMRRRLPEWETIRNVHFTWVRQNFLYIIKRLRGIRSGWIMKRSSLIRSIFRRVCYWCFSTDRTTRLIITTFREQIIFYYVDGLIIVG